MRIAVIGTGYVGLVAGACFADVGNSVICVDNDKNKLKLLSSGHIPIYEPRLSEMVLSNIGNKKLRFTSNIDLAVKESEICFIAVGTPSNDDGSANLAYVFDVAKQIAKAMNGYKVVVIKSTCPVGTSKRIYSIISKSTKYKFDVVSNPEFLKQGNAVEDFLHPDRTIIGSNSKRAINSLLSLYSSFYRRNERFLIMDPASAEMTKYAANAFLATKISFINEISNLCEKVGADVELVRKGLISDPRIGDKFLYPGIGFGGSCFPKDVKALISLGRDNGYNPSLIVSTWNINKIRSNLFVDKIKAALGKKLYGKKIAVWGLSFKPNTNDIRESPSIKVIYALLKSGCNINVFDPKAMPAVKEIFKNKIKYYDNQYDALLNCSCLVIFTEWGEFRNPDFKKIGRKLSRKIIIDARNIYNPNVLKANGFIYVSFGRK